MPAHKHPEEAEPDSHFHWTTPDEGTQMEFVRDRTAVLQMASEWDLCISGDGLTHLQQIGQEAAFIPLAQVSPDNLSPSSPCQTLHWVLTLTVKRNWVGFAL